MLLDSSSLSKTAFYEMATAMLPALQKQGVTSIERDIENPSIVSVNYSPRVCVKRKNSSEDLARKICRTLKDADPFVVVVTAPTMCWIYNEAGLIKRVDQSQFDDNEYGEEHKSISSLYREHPNLTTVTLKAITDSELPHKASCFLFWKRR